MLWEPKILLVLFCPLVQNWLVIVVHTTAGHQTTVSVMGVHKPRHRAQTRSMEMGTIALRTRLGNAPCFGVQGTNGGGIDFSHMGFAYSLNMGRKILGPPF
jgi:hypothetical protein